VNGLKTLVQDIRSVPSDMRTGRVCAIRGLLIEIAGLESFLAIGSRLHVETDDPRGLQVEIVGFSDRGALAMPYGAVEGVGLGARATLLSRHASVYPDESWLGRIVNAFGEPIDGKGPIRQSSEPYFLRGDPLPAHERQRVGDRLDLGVRALNTFVTMCRGQRMGIFAGSGVGKSVLMSMVARFSKADVNVIGLVGERGREVKEFIEDDLGEEGLARSVVVVATSDESALMRRQAAYLTVTLAEYFRDRNREVICLMDSVTRFAMAQREIGLAGGEPPTTKGYTPTVFTELPRLLERAGPGRAGTGNITGLFTVLVEGDDHNEPVADAVRGILDGHIVMERSIAERGRYPSINVLRSVSRTMPGCHSDSENHMIREARRFMSAYSDMEEMIRLGAYRPGSNPEVDAAIQYHPMFEAFLGQHKSEYSSIAEGFQGLYTDLAKGPADLAPVDLGVVGEQGSTTAGAQAITPGSDAGNTA